MDTILQQLINGVTVGSMYALIALGYTMVYGVLLLLNFAHGDLFMVGSYVAIAILALAGVTGGLGVAAIAGLLLTIFLVSGFLVAGLGVAIEKVAYKPLRNSSRLAPMLSALGVSLVLENAAMLVAGRAPRVFPNGFFPSQSYHLFGATFTNHQVLILVVSAALLAGMYYLVNRTILGLQIRAVAENRNTASLMGVNIDRTISLVFVIGPALGAAAGVMFSMYYGVAFFTMGFTAGIKAFTAAVLGGIGNIPGAMVGGILLGLLETFGAGLLPIISGGLLTPEYKDIFAFLVLILVLIFRPMGLLGERIPMESMTWKRSF
ncbi:MAG TPA: branched-chain amino acid ABC transporter permease [Chloroflexota bacterium]|nr:branched-chain amino acid ABC transporter permease [Chloroflexota bacterium]